MGTNNQKVLEVEGSESQADHGKRHTLTVQVDAGVPTDGAAVELFGDPTLQKITKAKKKVAWPNLEPGLYTIEVTAKGKQTETREVTVPQAQGRPERVRLVAKPTLTVSVFAGDALISGVACHLYRGDDLLDCQHTTKEGEVRFTVDRAGEYSLVVPQILRVGKTGSEPARTLYCKLPGRFSFSVEGGKDLPLRVDYTATGRELRVRAILAENGEEAEMSGVVVTLYQQDGRPLQTLTTAGAVPAVFSGLADDVYVLRVVKTPALGGQSVELVDPPDGVLTFRLEAGQTLDATLRFRLARGAVLGHVYAAGLDEGLAGVPLILIGAGNEVLGVTTGPYGDFRCDVAAGTYTLRLAQDKVTSADGQHWELAPDSPAQRTVVVRAGQPAATLPFVLVRKEHILDVDVLGADGQPVPFAQVYVRDEKGDAIGNGFATDANGHVTIYLEREGIYRVGLDVDPSGNPILAPQVVSVHSRANTTLRLRGPASASPAQPAGPAQTVVDIPYPLLAETAMAPSWPAGGAAPAAADPGRIVQSTLNEVLGWRSRAYKVDGRGFVAALNQAFTVKEVQGHTELAWIPRSYAVVQDMGALTGAQASIYNRARVALDQALPLLDGLYPLRPDADEQDVEAIRAIVRSGFTELVGELSLEGGPRVPRVDALFESLLGTNGTVDPEQVEGQLGELAHRFGLVRARVNTIEEEQNLTNFLIAVDYVIALRQSWNVQRPFFTRGSGAQPFFGTQLVLVSRALAVVSESVQEACQAMDSVFLGPAERQVVELAYPDQPPLFVAELLSWVDDAASEEGPRLIQEGGKQGVVAFQPTLSRLARLVRGALVPPQNPNNLPAGYGTARVQRSLQELADHLEEAAQLSGQLSRRPEESQLYYRNGEPAQRAAPAPASSSEPAALAPAPAPGNGRPPGLAGGTGGLHEPFLGGKVDVDERILGRPSDPRIEALSPFIFRSDMKKSVLGR